MRRSEREITDINELERILSEAQVCRIALVDGEAPYIIPMCFGYTLEGDQLVLYFHSAPQGKKMELIKANNNAAFELDRMGDIIAGDTACSFSVAYECITGRGTLDIINGIEKLTGLNTIMAKYDKTNREHKYSEQSLNNVAILKLTVDEFCCKAHGAQ
ncbi:MAG: pyridoxamine 5'-phosphate oxidase family protein [Ruminococcaceae bacterium]|nr:pyridoxamine 5'-phosphate oxidase family protein [Oscillospiraceae bacterium]